MTNDWQEQLQAGNIAEARRLYQQTGEASEVLAALDEALRIQGYVRAKAWRQALEDLNAASLKLLGLDSEQLAQGIAALAENSDRIDRIKLEELTPVQSSPLFAEYHAQEGMRQIFLGNTEKALEEFEWALRLDGKHYRALTNRGNVRLEHQQLPQAIQDYETALAIRDNFPNALHNLAVAYRKQGNISKSVSLLRKAQKALRQQEQEEARGRLTSQDPKQTLLSKYLAPKYLLYTVLAIIVLWWLFKP